MKKLTTILSIAAMVLAASCNKAETPVQEEAMTYSVSVPMTKAVNANGSEINKVWYGLYKTDDTLVSNYQPVEFKNGSANCQVVMMRGQSYKIVFVAQHDATYSIDADNAIVSMPSTPVANTDENDLFYYLEEVKDYAGQKTGAVVLNRAVALVNFRSNDTDWANANTLGATPAYSSVTLKDVPTTFDLLSGETNATLGNVTYSRSSIPGDKYLAAAYCFVPESNITAEVNLYTADSDASLVRTLEVGNVPVEANMQTNITGAIMTGTVDFDITISAGNGSTDKEI